MVKEKTSGKTIEELEAEHGRLASVEIPSHGLLAFRAPTSEEWARFQDGIASAKGSNVTAAKLFLSACRVYPEGAEMAAALRDYPGAVIPLADAIGELSGDEFEIRIKKD